MKKEVKNSIFADGKSKITNAKNVVKTQNVKTKYTIIGFIMGVLSSLVATYIYEKFLK